MIIHKLSEGVFYSNIVCEKESEVVKIDSRTSDAIALSIRFNAPIFVTKEIIDEAGFEDDEKYLDGINLTDENFFKDNLSSLTESKDENTKDINCLLYTSPSPRD